MSSRVQEIAAFTVRIAREAGEIAMEGFRNRDLGIDLKADFHDMVTTYDRACEQHIRGEIEREYPGSSIVGEEEGESAGSGRLTWFIDPIDGTANFARGIAMWAVSIGVALDGEMVAGAVFDPANDHMFWADDRGAFLNDEPLRSWGFTRPEQATVGANFPLPRDLIHLREQALEQFADVTDTFAQVRALGAATTGLCWVAAGWIDAVFSFEAHSWDIAASGFIIRQAGGVFLTYRDGEITPAAESHLHPHYIATVPGADFPLLHEILRTQSRRPLPANY